VRATDAQPTASAARASDEHLPRVKVPHRTRRLTDALDRPSLLQARRQSAPRHGSCVRPAATCLVRRSGARSPTIRSPAGELTARLLPRLLRFASPRITLLSPSHCRCCLPHAEFMAVRKEHSFFECCQTPEIASEITLQPIRRYSGLLDAAIILCAPA
jgi:hypothetical protein